MNTACWGTGTWKECLKRAVCCDPQKWSETLCFRSLLWIILFDDRVSGSLLDEQKSHLLQTFKEMCTTGLQTDGNQTDSNNESTLIRCNCCYNLPVHTCTQTHRQTLTVRQLFRWWGHFLFSPFRLWWFLQTQLISYRSCTLLSLVFVVTQRSVSGAAQQPVSTRWDPGLIPDGLSSGIGPFGWERKK